MNSILDFPEAERQKAEALLWARIEKTDRCWIWKGKTTEQGYGLLSVHSVNLRAHRVTYELEHGRIPQGHEIDHLCRNHGCVNPAHLDAVVHRTNVLRGQGTAAIHARQLLCKNGHPLSGPNVYVNKGKRYCRTCVANWHSSKWREKRNSARREPSGSQLQSRASGDSLPPFSHGLLPNTYIYLTPRSCP